MRIDMNTQPKNQLQFSVLDFINEVDRNRLASKATFIYTETGKLVKASPTPDTLYVITHGSISFRSHKQTYFEFGRAVVGRSLEMKALFNNEKAWEFAWYALEPTTLMAISWKEFRECLAKNKLNETYVRRSATAIELQRLTRDLKAFACPQVAIEEIVAKFIWYKDQDLVKKLKPGGNFFIVVSTGSIELLADAEGKLIPFASVYSGQHFILKCLPSTTLRFQPNTSGFILSEAEWKTLKCHSDFEFFLKLHAGVKTDDIAERTVIAMTKSIDGTRGDRTRIAKAKWSFHPVASLRSFLGRRYLVWAPDDTWLRDACLLSLARLHGHDNSLEAVRQEFLSFQDDEILSCIKKVGHNLGYELKITKTDVPTQAPAIITYQNKPFVLLSCNSEYVEIGDTYSLKTRVIAMNRLRKNWGGEVLTWEGQRPASSLIRSAPVFQYFRLLKGSFSSLFLLLCAGLLSTLFVLVGLLLSQFIFERMPHETNNEVVYMVLGGYMICLVMASTVGWIEKAIRARLQWTLNAKVNSAYVQHVTRIPLSAFDSLNKGEVFNRLNDAKALSDFLTTETIKFFINIASLFSCGAILYIFHPALCGVLIAVLPFILLVTWILPAKIKEASLRESQAKSVIKGRAIAAFENLETVVSNNALRSERWKVEAAMFREVNIKNQLIRFTIFREGLVTVLTELTKLGGLYLGVMLFMRHQISMGMVVGTPFLIERALSPLLEIFNLINRIPFFTATIQRLHSVFGTQSEALNINKKIAQPVHGDIKMRNVSFAFHTGGAKILEGVNLHIRPGEVIGIAGESGSGKSTLMNLINRLRKPTLGEIFLDDQNIEQLPLGHLRASIGCQPQAGGVMRGTIAENISMFDKNATIEKIERAARIACAHDMISSLTQGYSTMIDTSGTGLSEGQSQLVCIARLVYADPQVFILDESTAHIDAITEELIYKSLLTTFKGRTFVIVTQKLNALLKADRIIYIKDGKAVESGTHSQLIKDQGPYCDFVCKQVCVNI